MYGVLIHQMRTMVTPFGPTLRKELWIWMLTEVIRIACFDTLISSYSHTFHAPPQIALIRKRCFIRTMIRKRCFIRTMLLFFYSIVWNHNTPLDPRKDHILGFNNNMEHPLVWMHLTGGIEKLYTSNSACCNLGHRIGLFSS